MAAAKAAAAAARLAAAAAAVAGGGNACLASASPRWIRERLLRRLGESSGGEETARVFGCET